MKNYQSIIKEKGWDAYEHQGSFLSNPEFYEPTKPIVLAVGTGGGKTFTTIMKLDIYYSNPTNKGKKTVVFPHATNVLKANFKESLEKKYGNKSFSHCVIQDSSEILNVFNSDCEVIVVLPQTIKGVLEHLPQVEWMIVDEAHEWYCETSYNNIIDVLKPKYQLLLTGTPSKFNGKPDEFYYHHVSVDELRKVGKLGNARIDIVSSDYNMEGQDVLRNGNLHTRVTDDFNNTVSSFHKLCVSMLQTLGNVEGNDVKSLFEHLDKTIIFCNSQFQANQFHDILKNKMKGQVLKSLSSDGGDSEEFDIFKQNSNVKVLILVRKGRLGFDMDNLYNIVDFTLSTNVDNISQMVGRILRPDSNGTIKRYFKVSPSNTVWYYQSIMMVVLRLMIQDAYVIYNGEQNQVSIPQSERPRSTVQPTENIEELDFDNLIDDENEEFVEPTPRTPHFRNIDPDLIMDLNFFTEIENREQELFQSVSWCTLDDVRKECLGIRDRKTERTYEECLEAAKKYTKKTDFQYGPNLAEYSYAQKRGWIPQIVKDAKLSGRKLTLTKEECAECAKQYSTRREFSLGAQPKYKKAKQMGWLEEWFPEKTKPGRKIEINSVFKLQQN